MIALKLHNVHKEINPMVNNQGTPTSIKRPPRVVSFTPPLHGYPTIMITTTQLHNALPEQQVILCRKLSL